MNIHLTMEDYITKSLNDAHRNLESSSMLLLTAASSNTTAYDFSVASNYATSMYIISLHYAALLAGGSNVEEIIEISFSQQNKDLVLDRLVFLLEQCGEVKLNKDENIVSVIHKSNIKCKTGEVKVTFKLI